MFQFCANFKVPSNNLRIKPSANNIGSLLQPINKNKISSDQGSGKLTILQNSCSLPKSAGKSFLLINPTYTATLNHHQRPAMCVTWPGNQDRIIVIALHRFRALGRKFSWPGNTLVNRLCYLSVEARSDRLAFKP